jgi:putative ABC transport system permease protein
MEQLVQDARYALRGFLREPGFSLAAILALALGIGANTAVFSVVYGVLLKPLPFPDPNALVLVHDTYPAVQNAAVSFPKLLALKEGTRTLEALGGYGPLGVTLTGSREPEQVTGFRVSADFFRALKVEPMLGRWFTDQEDLPHGPNAIILSETLWRRRFASDPMIVGEPIQVDGVARTVVGVMRQETQYPATSQFWVPLSLPRPAGGGNFMRLLGRMRPGVSVERVQQELAALSTAFNTQQGLQRDVKVWPLHEWFVTSNRRTLLVLQGTVAFVLLVACANVANLLLARSVTRQRELAIRAAIGARRGRIVRQLLTESVLLSAAGALVGILLGSWLLRLFVALAPPSFPRLNAIAMDRGVLAFTMAVAAFTGLLFGLAPAGRGFRTNPNDSLRDTAARGSAGKTSRGASRLLVIAEVAIALILVVGAGLLVKSLLRLQNEQPGFQTEGIFTFNVNLPSAKYPNTAPREFYRRFIDEIRSVPGVQSAAAINYAPMTNFGLNGPFAVKGQPPFEQGKSPVSEYRVVTPGYFATMGIPVLRGADFTEQHNDTDRPVAIINETMARQHFGGTDPIGAQLTLGADARGVVREVVGVVGDVRDATLGRKPVPETFIPHAQVPFNAMALVVRTAEGTPMDRILPSVRQRLATLDADVPVVRPQTLRAAADATAGTTRMTSTLTSVFALVAALLASVGVYSLISYSVAQRTREIGIRMALGANQPAVIRLVVGEGLMLAAAGIAAGLAGSLLVTRALETMLYEVAPTDPGVLAATCAGVLVVTVLASLVPALQATRVDPAVALRTE